MLTVLFMTIGLIPAVTQQPENPDRAGRPVKEPALRVELLKRMKAEQDIRMDLFRLNPTSRPLTPEERNKPEMKAVMEQMEQIDKDNLAWFKKVVEKHGWPGMAMVGDDGAQAAFLIAQHAARDLNFMAKCLPLLKAAYKAGDAEGQWVALMTDRLLILKDKKKQLYGTQLMHKDGRLVPQPIEDEANVDKRRKELQMRPLADYLQTVNERAGVPAKPRDK
jgi:hypothetical protein